MLRERTGAVAVGGVALVTVVVAWRLGGASVRGDIETICFAELRSGWTLRTEMPALTEWTRRHLTTPEGNTLDAALRDVAMAERGQRLRAEAAAHGIGSCPLAASYDALALEGDERADLQRLCSYVTFPDFANGDDRARLEVLEAWIERDASTARTRALAGPLRDAATPADRAQVLRAASSAVDMLRCDLAGILETPPPLPDAGAGDSGPD
jgi:hypothetical protein